MKKHTDSGFTFDIKEDHAAVMKLMGIPDCGNSGTDRRSTGHRTG